MLKPIPRGRGLSCVLALAVLAMPACAAIPTTRPARASFDPDEYLAHVKYLASDELEGRQPGTPGIELAAEYIAREFERAGLRPGGENGTWFQAFDVARGKRVNEQLAAFKLEESGREWTIGKDWVPFPFSIMRSVRGPLAFAGYGIKIEPQDEAQFGAWNDYADFDVQDKVLLIFRYEPPRPEEHADDQPKPGPSHYATFRSKAETAARLGARALLVVNPRGGERPDELFAFDRELSEHTYDLPMLHVSRPLAAALLQQAGLPDLDTLQERLERDRKPQSADLKLEIELNPGLEQNNVPTRNVLGVLPGVGHTTETIVVGAHYDHVGKSGGGPGEEPVIHNGADDNASGTAGIIELARVLAAEGGQRRNVLFTAYSAEEMGLLGSAHWLDHPTLPLTDVRAMVNFDMIGRLGAERFSIFGVNTGEEFDELVKRAAAEVELDFRSPRGMVDNSDHAGFYRKNIPVLFPFTGVHKDYHQPGDDWEKIDAPGAVRILTAFRTIVRELAEMENGPTFVAADSEPEPEDEEKKPAVEHAEEQATTQESAPENPPGEVDRRGRASRPGVTLGIMPDFQGGDEPGVVADAVTDGGGAQAAGMLAGDRIIKIGDKHVRDIYGYMAALRGHQPGDAVDVVVVRKDKGEVTLRVTLKKSERRRDRD